MDDGTKTALKERQRKTWEAGDFAEIAKRIETPSLDLLDALGVEAGMTLLDVACGTGNVVIPAAERGATVTGLDITPKLLEVARERAAEAGVEAELVEGDAENLPFDDGSFDRVTSVFGTMFAPDHSRAAAELVRVCRPGGRVGFCAWTPQGLNGRMFGVVGSYLPPPPDGFQPPVLWGEEAHVRDLLSPLGVEPSFERRSIPLEADSVEDWVATGERHLGPMVMAKAALEPEGRWEALRGDLVSLYESYNEATDGSMRAQTEYLMTTVEIPG
jgi:ubiquinone/menaquinone biosynthesis C-methylase UbiE